MRISDWSSDVCSSDLRVFSHPSHAREAIEILYRVQALHPFFLFGFVIMPDHCHLLMRVPEPASISTVIGRFKMGVSHALGIGPIWQPRYYMKIASNRFGALRYIHENPVRANIVPHAEDYLWSSACGKWDVTDLEFDCEPWDFGSPKN